MARLKAAARAYCLRHAIPLDRLFDATGMKRAVYKEVLGTEGKWAAYGVTVCLNGHDLRSRHGKCLMCDPQQVAHMLRSKLPGWLYIAVGGLDRVMKLGFSTNPQERIKIANYEAWGGFGDWRLYALSYSESAGKLESAFHAHFQNQHVPLSWTRNGAINHTRESFLADPESAYAILAELTEREPVKWH